MNIELGGLDRLFNRMDGLAHEINWIGWGFILWNELFILMSLIGWNVWFEGLFDWMGWMIGRIDYNSLDMIMID